MTITVKQLAEELDMTVANVNIQIGKGHAGDVQKVGEGETKEYSLTKDNVLTLLKWIRINGRSNRRLVRLARQKYEEMD